MLIVRDIPDDPLDLDVETASLLAPVPADGVNSILFETRDGDDALILRATGIHLTARGEPVARVESVDIDVIVTNARVAFACSKYDKGGGWWGIGDGAFVAVAANVISKTRAAIRRRGTMLVGQVRYPWLQRVGSTSKTTRATTERLVFDCMGDVNVPLRLTVFLDKREDAAVAAAEITRRTALYRLGLQDTRPEHRPLLDELATAEPQTPVHASNQIAFFQFPSYWFVNAASAALKPHNNVVGARGANAGAMPTTRNGGSFCDQCGSAMLAADRYCDRCGSPAAMGSGR